MGGKIVVTFGLANISAGSSSSILILVGTSAWVVLALTSKSILFDRYEILVCTVGQTQCHQIRHLQKFQAFTALGDRYFHRQGNLQILI